MKNLLSILGLLVCTFCFGAVTNTDTLIHTTDRQYRQLEKKYTATAERISRNLRLVMKRIKRAENRLSPIVASRNSKLASQLFDSTQRLYDVTVQGDTGSIKISSKQYSATTDSIETMFRYLLNRPTVAVGDKLHQLSSTAEAFNSMESRLRAAGRMEELMDARRKLLEEQLAGMGLVKELKRFQKEVFYYKQQIKAYRELLHHPDQLAAKLLATVRNLPSFRSFMTRNSQLAQFFPQAATANGAAGLQTRAWVQQQLTGMSQNVNAPASPGQSLQLAGDQLSVLKNKLNLPSGGDDITDIPAAFKPNSQRTKTFLERMEYGVNIQSQRPNGLLPVTTEVAFTAGYKINDNSSMGIGAGYKLGWGKDLRNIHFTAEGFSLRSFIDIRIKKSIWFSGGYERHFVPAVGNQGRLPDAVGFSESGLVGITKKYRVGKKENRLQLLWDFLSYQQMPRRPVFNLRLGYPL